MKKYIFILLALPLILSSCLKNDTDTFGQIPGERIEQFNQEVNKILKDAPNGWVMTYYSGRALEYGGYKVYMKFDGNEKVTIASEISTWRGESIEEAAKETETSTYTLGKDYGPTLNFDTYNTLFHMFAEADTGLTIGAGEPGMGMGGDSEFIIMSADKDKIVLRGKKAQFDVTMTPLPADQTWEQSLKEYYTAYKSMDVMPSYQLELGGKTYEMSRYNDVLFWRHFSFYLSEAEILDASFQYTLTGIMFRDPVVIDGISISEMKWDGNGYTDAASGAKITKITSSNEFTITVSKVEAAKATVSVSPTIATEYYYINAYPKADENSKSEVQIIQELMANINSASDLSKGNATKTLKVKELTEYVACAFGIYVNGQGEIAASTGLYKSAPFTTPKDVPQTEDYKAWLGTWTVTSTSSEVSKAPLTFDVTFSESERNASYAVLGWSISGPRLEWPVVCQFRASDGKLLMSNYSLGLDSEGYEVYWNCRAFDPSDGKIYVDNRTGITMIGTIDASKQAASVVGEVFNATNVYSMDFFAWGDDGIYSYNPASGFTSRDYPIGPYKLVKKSNATAPQYVVDFNAYQGFNKSGLNIAK